MNREDTLELLNELVSSIKSRGLRKTINSLKTKNTNKVDLDDPFDLFVVESVAKHFNTTTDELLYGKYLRGRFKYAMGLCIYFIYENKSLGEIHKKLFVNKNKSLISKYRQIINDLNPNHIEDKKIIQIKEELETIINNFKKDNK